MDAILLVDHGSRVAAANAQLERVAALVADRVPGRIVGFAHMELASPTVAEGVDACVSAGATRLTVVPYMLAPGRHVLEDIPRLVEEAVAEGAGITVTVTAPLGVHPALADVVLARVQERESAPVESSGR